MIEESVKIIPDKEKWTYICCPLGLIHKVEKTEGTRISLIRAVYGLEHYTLEIDEERVRKFGASIHAITG